MALRFTTWRMLALAGLLALAVAVTPVPSEAEVRLALVIGNNEYGNGMSKLPEAANDARDMAETLASLGFKVTRAPDLTRESLELVLKEFAENVRKEEADWALIYYSGHGFQVGGESYMLPIDRKPGVNLRKELDALNKVKKLRIAIFDACRTDPEVDRARLAASAAVAKGNDATVKRSISSSSIIAYASKDEKPAQATEGRNSIYTETLLSNLTTPGLELRELLEKVGTQVKQVTSNRPGWDVQEPWKYDALESGQRYYFVQKPAVVMDTVPSRGKIMNFFGGTYEGEIANGLPNGWGRFSGGEWPNGVIEYEGHWREGKFDGIGVAKYKWRNTYQGRWLGGQKHGLGIEGGPWNSQGFEYAGSFERNYRKGHGVHWVSYSTKDEQEVKVGEFDKDLVQGVGVDVRMSDKHAYLVVETGKRDTKGRLQGRGQRFNGEFYYRGNFRDGLFDGQGLYMEFGGSERFGWFREGKQDGLGFIKWPGEYSYYEGMISDWKPNGFGSATYPEVRATKRIRVSGDWTDGCHPDGGEFLCRKSK